MPLLRIHEVKPGTGFSVRLTLTDGSVIERDLTELLVGPVFEPLRKDLSTFQRVTVEAGTIIWPNGADLDPDVLIWGGMAPKDTSSPPPSLRLKVPSLVP